MLTGHCHCGAVAFEVNGPILTFQHCHCATCRRIHGTVYNSSAVTERSGFNLLRGADAITEYESSPGKKHPSRHIWVSHKAPWYEILDDLPRIAEM